MSGGDMDDEVTEKEILLAIFREVRWIGRCLAVIVTVGIVVVGAALILGGR